MKILVTALLAALMVGCAGTAGTDYYEQVENYGNRGDTSRG